MSTLTASLIFAAPGGSFLLETRTPSEIFTPEDLNEEQRQIAATAASGPTDCRRPTWMRSSTCLRRCSSAR